MNHIFISYSHRDSGFVDLLQEFLERMDYRVWRDVANLRAGQKLSKEVTYAIQDARAFVIVISEHYDKSTWLDNELTLAMRGEIPIIPIVFEGISPPIQVAGLSQIRTPAASSSVGASQMLEVVGRVATSVGETSASYEIRNSSDCEWNASDDLVSALVGTRWTWCENELFETEGMWIEFQSDGKLLRSWKNDLTKWTVTTNEFVLYHPHILKFNMFERSFQGFNFDDSSLRSGQRIGGIWLP